MIKYENECVGCTSLGLPCIGASCDKIHVPHSYCDKCGEEEELYHYNGMHMCMDCIKNSLIKVHLDEYIDY